MQTQARGALSLLFLFPALIFGATVQAVGSTILFQPREQGPLIRRVFLRQDLVPVELGVCRCLALIEAADP